MRKIKAAVALLMMVSVGWADNLKIASFSGGNLGWVFPTNGVGQYRVEWTADPVGGQWTDLSSGSGGIAPTGTTMQARVPMFFRVRSLAVAPSNMVYVPAGSLMMGDTFGEDEWDDDELPVHPVHVSAFYMDKYEVTKALWDEVYVWATNNGYSFTNTISGKAADHPIQGVTWYACVKWANARSEMEDLTPCYYMDAGTSLVYRSGEVDLTNPNVRWDADGYRLPTEAEWERAARGGVDGRRFPWADDTISHGRANYEARGSWDYNLSSGGYHPAYTNGVEPFTSPVNAFTPNAFGIYGLAGNVGEWCWDQYEQQYYAASPASDPHGPVRHDRYWRVIRGSDWRQSPNWGRCAARGWLRPEWNRNAWGFRTVRGVGAM